MANRMFEAAEFYGEPHDWNGNAEHADSFYFAVERPETKERLSAYVTRESFNYLAAIFGTLPLVGVIQP